MIQSASNQHIKHIQQLLEKSKYRRETGLFVIEGIRMFLETPKERIDKVFVSEEFMKKSIHADKVKKLSYEVIADQVFKKMSGTQTPQGILATVKRNSYTIDDILSKEGMYLILNGVQDPGNIGTMVRTAEGAGAAGIILDRGCADIYSPKVVRATMGSIYRVPFVVADDLKEALLKMKNNGVRLLAGHLKGDDYFIREDYAGSIGILIGNEGNGLSDEISEMADILVRIPMGGKLESLNAAVAAALFMYEYRRRR